MISEFLGGILPFVQATLKTIWASVPNGIGTAIGAYFGTRHVTARLEKLSKKAEKLTKKNKK